MSEFSISEMLLFQVILIFLNAIFACSEIAVISINGNKLKKLSASGDKRANHLLSLTKQPAKFLATIQVGITLAGFLASAFAADNFSDKVVDWLIDIGVSISPSKLDVLAVIGITIILSYFTLIFGEIVPKRIAMQNPEKVALSLSWLVYGVAKISTPLVWFLSLSTNMVLKFIGINPNQENDKVSKDEIKIMIDACNENGDIDDIEKELLNKVFEFDDKRVRDVMVHRRDTVFLNLADTKDKWEKIMSRSRHSVYPIYDKHKDNVIGTISIKDYFNFKDAAKSDIIQKAVKPTFVTIDTLHIDELFLQMQKQRKHFSVVVDEYGSISGIITIKDLLEEIVGDLGDDVTNMAQEPLIVQINNAEWKIKGNTPIKEVGNKLKMKFPQGSYTTFSGFLFSLMSNIPRNKKDVVLQYRDWQIFIPQIKERRIDEAIVKHILH